MVKFYFTAKYDMTYFTNPLVTDWHKQIIKGTILGGSSIVLPKGGRNSYLFMRSKIKEWIIYKANELKDFSSQRPFTEEGTTLRWHSNCFPIFNEIRKQFYNGNDKKVTMEMLDSLRDIGLSIWYGDCGKLRGDSIVFNTQKFGEDGSAIINKYFNEIGIKSNVVKEKNTFRVILTPEGSLRFMATIAHQLPEFMIRKQQEQD